VPKPSISYAQHADITLQAELGALASVYRVILSSVEKRGRLLDKSGPDDGPNVKGESANEYRSR
jgi:hypothetical protein